MRHSWESYGTDVFAVSEYDSVVEIHLSTESDYSARVQPGGGTDRKVILTGQQVQQDSPLVLRCNVYIPWDVAEKIHDAYEHELAGLDHEVPA